ncbi:hypothetical protein RZS08_61050, partial [Arthrospira platensis SPKY1]|nr:hypothetical protein [Arthrospira platensis SPKY1]
MSGLDNPKYFLVAAGLAVLGVMFVSALISVWTLYRLSMFGAQVGAELSIRLYTHYMQQPWLFHAMGSSAQLIKQVSTEALRVSNLIIQPLMQLNAKLILASIISLAI